MGFVSSVFGVPVNVRISSDLGVRNFWRTCERMNFVRFWRNFRTYGFRLVSFWRWRTSVNLYGLTSVFGVTANVWGSSSVFGVPVNERMSVLGVPSYGFRLVSFWRTCERADFVSF